MWVEAIVSKGDLGVLAAEVCPVTVLLDGRGELRLSAPREVSLVPEVGLRFACDATLVWPALGMDRPLALSLGALIRLRIETCSSGDAVAFDLAIEHVNFPSAPDVRFERIERRLNRELAEQCVDCSWDFSRALRNTLRLSEVLEPLLALDLEVDWGRVRVTAEAIVLAISFRSTIIRYSESKPLVGCQSSGWPLGCYVPAPSAVDDARAIIGRSAPPSIR